MRNSLLTNIRFILWLTILIYIGLPNSEPFAQVSALAQTPGTIQLSWTAPGDDGVQGQADKYSVRYSTDSLTLVNWDLATEAPSNAPLPSGSAETLTITGLSPETRYYCAIKTSDEANNWSTISNIVTATTAGSSLQLTGVNAAEIGVHEVRIEWTTSEPGTGQIYYGFTIALGFSTPLDSSLRTTHSLWLDSLPAAANIYFRVASRDSLGLEVLRSFYQITTDSASLPPEPIADLNAVSGSANGEIDLTWTSPADDGPDSSVSYYVIQLSLLPFGEFDTAGIVVYPSPPTPLATGANQQFTLTSLEMGARYYLAIRSVDAEGNVSALSNLDSAVATYSIIAGIDDDQSGLPEEYSLDQNYPNPFNPSTTIAYALPEAEDVLLQVFNINGQLVNTLIRERQSAGYHELEWDGRSTSGNQVATGLYLYRIVTSNFVESKKMMLIK